MTTTTEILEALRELANLKQLDHNELTELLRDGIYAALAKQYGPTVEAEIEIDEAQGLIRVAVLRTVVGDVEDPACQVSLEDAKFEDDEFQIGDVLEEEVPFEDFGRTAVLAAK